MNATATPQNQYETKLADLRKAQVEVRKTLRMLLLSGLVFPVLFTLFILFVLHQPVDDDEATLFLADGLLLPLAIGVIMWRRTGLARDLFVAISVQVVVKFAGLPSCHLVWTYRSVERTRITLETIYLLFALSITGAVF